VSVQQVGATREVTAPEPEGGEQPQLSVILVTDGIELVRETLAHLGEQSARGRIEVVIATPGGSLDGAGELTGFHSVTVIDSDSRKSTPVARAMAVEAAHAPVVAMAETHCFPDPDWAEILIEAHRGPWAAVGPEIDNENPERPASWANLYVDYAAWLSPATSGPIDDLPGHNTSYKRELLLAYGAELPHLLLSESVLHWDLRSHGHRLYQEAQAKVRHRNINRPVPALIEHFHNGRCFGAARSRNWSLARRALYAAGSPLIPVIRLRRILRDIRRTNRGHILPRALPMMMSSLSVHAIGEMLGYATGAGNAPGGMAKYELERDVFVEGATQP
jgi:hypothetical protein